MSAKDCGHHDEVKKKLYRRLITAFLTLTILILLTILLTWLILRPTKPHFTLQDATVYSFNLTNPNLLTSNLQVTMSSRNPNERIGIYYDKLDIYASYKGQQITLPTSLPPSYQGHKDTVVWSPFVSGNVVPMAPFLAVTLNQDQMVGTVLVSVRVVGRIRWKVGVFVTGTYHLSVNCPAYINLGRKSNGFAVGSSALKYQLIMDCHVDV